MKKIIFSSLTVMLATQAIASNNNYMVKNNSNFQSKSYLIFKGLMSKGAKVKHAHNITLEGNDAKGFAVDFGYNLPYGFSTEFIFSYAQNSVKETDASDPLNIHHKDIDATYFTYGSAFVYTVHLTQDSGLFLKAGYKTEVENLDGDKNNQRGLIYAVGGEYKIFPLVWLLAEYEKSTINGPKGNNFYFGLKSFF